MSSRQQLRAAKRRLAKAQSALSQDGEAFNQAAAEKARKEGSPALARRYRRAARKQTPIKEK